jgi:hypothetical protein
VVAEFQRLGCAVLDLSQLGKGCPDVLVSLMVDGKPKSNWLVEIKNGDAAKLTDDQKEFLSWWQGPVSVVRDLDGVATVVRLIRGGDEI